MHPESLRPCFCFFKPSFHLNRAANALHCTNNESQAMRTSFTSAGLFMTLSHVPCKSVNNRSGESNFPFCTHTKKIMERFIMTSFVKPGTRKQINARQMSLIPTRIFLRTNTSIRYLYLWQQHAIFCACVTTYDQRRVLYHGIWRCTTNTLPQT